MIRLDGCCHARSPKTELIIEVENNKFSSRLHTCNKWPVLKEKDIKYSQEFISIPFMQELDHESKIIKKLLVIKENVLGCKLTVHRTQEAAKNMFL